MVKSSFAKITTDIMERYLVSIAMKGMDTMKKINYLTVLKVVSTGLVLGANALGAYCDAKILDAQMDKKIMDAIAKMKTK